MRRERDITGSQPAEPGKARGVSLDDLQRLHALVEANPFPVLITRAADSMILYANEEFGRAAGVPAHELVGRKALEYYLSPEGWDTLLAKLPAEGKLDGYEAQGKHQDGSLFGTMASVRRILFGGEQAIYTVFPGNL